MYTSFFQDRNYLFRGKWLELSWGSDYDIVCNEHYGQETKKLSGVRIRSISKITQQNPSHYGIRHTPLPTHIHCTLQMTISQEIEEWNRNIEAWIDSSERQSLVIIVRIAGILTFLGAGYIIQDILKDADRRKPTRNRIILVMSSCDVLDALVHSIIASFMIPKDSGIPGAVGNQLTCDIQGFLAFSSGSGSGMYNVSLAICYLLMVRYDYSDEQLRKFEPYFLCLPITFCFLFAITSLPFGVFNFEGTYTCFISPSPLDCDKPESPVECERGALYMYWYYFSGSVICLESVVIIFCMIRMYTAVLHQETNRHCFSVEFLRRFFLRNSSNSTPLSSMMSSQGLWYSGAFLFTFVPAMIYVMTENYWTHFLCIFTYHILGFTNAVIYVRPSFLKLRHDFPGLGITSSLWYTLARKHPTTAEDLSVSSASSMSPGVTRMIGGAAFKQRITTFLSGNRCKSEAPGCKTRDNGMNIPQVKNHSKDVANCAEIVERSEEQDSSDTTTIKQQQPVQGSTTSS